MKIDIAEIIRLNGRLTEIGGKTVDGGMSQDGELATVCKKINEELENVSNNILSDDLRATIINLKENIESLTADLAPNVAEVSGFLDRQMESYSMANQDATSSLQSLISQINSTFVLYSAAPTSNAMQEMPANNVRKQGDPIPEAKFNEMLAEAEKYLKKPYVWGGKTPDSSFDCGGYVSWVIGQSGWNYKYMGAKALHSFCTETKSPQPGDLVFFKNTYEAPDPYGETHVGIYVGNGKMIHTVKKTGVSYADISSGYWKDHLSSYGRLPLS